MYPPKTFTGNIAKLAAMKFRHSTYCVVYYYYYFFFTIDVNEPRDLKNKKTR